MVWAPRVCAGYVIDTSIGWVWQSRPERGGVNRRSGSLLVAGSSKLFACRPAADNVVEELGVSERRACRVIGQCRSTEDKQPIRRDDEDALTSAIIRLPAAFMQPYSGEVAP